MSTVILAIDPGPEASAWVEALADDGTPIAHGKCGNDELCLRLANTGADVAVVEMVASYGMAVGREVFETCVWIGRFMEAWRARTGSIPHRLYRGEVKDHLCRSRRATDANIRQTLLDRFGPGREKAVGTKKKPGPLYGVSGDVWAALAVAVTWADTKGATDAA